ncbi:taste receptor type 2 member 1 [Pipistrellus kuhlii]|uniref:Taste receptor type 2 n=1 Tax=Pipistrellus kuhlii TaxID=59472 RepID=A0A7J7YZA9_PIPKU|nr:taste receptor type 2 member 1 [Pipistrellus kuhlii]KAF6367188.1 taste 2 receptor member 1 [Pipistrellus kuhlii]
MLQLYIIAHLILSVIQFLVGVLANGFIVVVNGTDLIRQRKMVPFDFLLCCLATFRIVLQMATIYVNLAVLSLIELSLFPGKVIIFKYVHESELWLATWLSVFYCAKIATIAHPLFFWLKLRISKMMPWLILGTLIYTFIISVFYKKQEWIVSQQSLFGFFSQNGTTPVEGIPVWQVVLFAIDYVTPLLIFLISALLLLFSLGRHTQKMRSTAMGTGHPGMSVYISALLSILCFLVLYISQYMMSVLVLSQFLKIRNSITLFCLLLFSSYPAVHSVILILGNSKLKQNVKKFLPHSKCCQ